MGISEIHFAISNDVFVPVKFSDDILFFVSYKNFKDSSISFLLIGKISSNTPRIVYRKLVNDARGE